MEDIILDQYVNLFLKKTSHINYRENGAFKSELFLIYALHKFFNSNRFVESGLDYGMSTKTLLELIDCDYLGIDLNPNCVASKIDRNNFRFLNIDANIFLENEIKEKTENKYSIFLDGPKGKEAADLKEKLLTYDNVMFVAIHDSYDGGLLNFTENRVFESMTNEVYNKKYFNLLNQRYVENVQTIFTLKNNNSENTYFDCYPSGPGISIYSKKIINFKI